MSESARRAPKISKDKVNYRHAAGSRRCGTCGMFERGKSPGGTGTCTLVAGRIDPLDVCDRWSRRG